MITDEQRRQFTEEARKMYEENSYEYKQTFGIYDNPKNWTDLPRQIKDFWLEKVIDQYGPTGDATHKGY